MAQPQLPWAVVLPVLQALDLESRSAPAWLTTARLPRTTPRRAATLTMMSGSKLARRGAYLQQSA